jgi:hypothetical protein
MIFLILSNSLAAARSRMTRSRLQGAVSFRYQTGDGLLWCLTRELQPSACRRACHSRRVGCSDPWWGGVLSGLQAHVKLIFMRRWTPVSDIEEVQTDGDSSCRGRGKRRRGEARREWWIGSSAKSRKARCTWFNLVIVKGWIFPRDLRMSDGVSR